MKERFSKKFDGAFLNSAFEEAENWINLKKTNKG
jgi:hypothetical protein